MRAVAAALIVVGMAGAQPARDAAEAARRWREKQEQAIRFEFFDLLSIPNVASNLGDMRKNAAFLRAMFERRGLAVRLLEVDGAPPAVFAERKVPGATSTVMYYVHYDGQPVEPRMWNNGDPFHPVLTGGDDPRIYARSASDDKAPLIAFAAAIDAMNAAGMKPSVNWKFFFDGEEEAGNEEREYGCALRDRFHGCGAPCRVDPPSRGRP